MRSKSAVVGDEGFRDLGRALDQPQGQVACPWLNLHRAAARARQGAISTGPLAYCGQTKKLAAPSAREPEVHRTTREPALEEAVDAVHCGARSVVGHAVVREIVGPYPLGSVAAADELRCAVAPARGATARDAGRKCARRGASSLLPCSCVVTVLSASVCVWGDGGRETRTAARRGNTRSCV